MNLIQNRDPQQQAQLSQAQQGLINLYADLQVLRSNNGSTNAMRVLQANISRKINRFYGNTDWMVLQRQMNMSHAHETF